MEFRLQLTSLLKDETRAMTECSKEIPKKMYRNINDKLDLILKSHDPNRKGVFLENISACLASFYRGDI